MSNASELLNRATALGLKIKPKGAYLSVTPRHLLSPGLASELKQHKAELMAMLQAKAANLPDDCGPWLHIARQILAGEFIGADKSTVESLTIGLRGIGHKLCREALTSLPANKERPRV